MSFKNKAKGEASFNQIPTFASFEIFTASTLSQIPENISQIKDNSQKSIQKARTQLNFKIDPLLGDIELPLNGKENEKLTKSEKKKEIFESMIKPLKGTQFYSYQTLQLKAEMDLIINRYFNENK